MTTKNNMIIPPHIIALPNYGCTGNPYPTAYSDALSYGEDVAKLWYKVQEIANSQNVIISNFQELLKWIDSMLKVYTEQQLQEWLDDGTLEGLIAGHLDIPIFLDTVEEMKTSNIPQLNSYVKTGGYYSINDGGGALYYITNIIPTTYYENLNNNMYAVLLNPVYAKQYGLKGDSTNESTKINQIYSYINELIFNDGTYCFSLSLQDKPQVFKCDKKSKIINYSNDSIFIYNNESFDNTISFIDINFELSGGAIAIDVNTNKFLNKYNKLLTIKSCLFKTLNNYTGSCVSLKYGFNFLIEGNQFVNEYLNNTSTSINLSSCLNGIIENNFIGYSNYGIKLNQLNFTNEGIYINKNQFLHCNNAIYAPSNGFKNLEISINNNLIDQIDIKGIYIEDVDSVSIVDNWFGPFGNNVVAIELASLSLGCFSGIIENNRIRFNSTNGVNGTGIKLSGIENFKITYLKISQNLIYMCKTALNFNYSENNVVFNNDFISGISSNVFVSSLNSTNLFELNNNGGISQNLTSNDSLINNKGLKNTTYTTFTAGNVITNTTRMIMKVVCSFHSVNENKSQITLSGLVNGTNRVLNMYTSISQNMYGIMLYDIKPGDTVICNTNANYVVDNLFYYYES